MPYVSVHGSSGGGSFTMSGVISRLPFRPRPTRHPTGHGWMPHQHGFDEVARLADQRHADRLRVQDRTGILGRFPFAGIAPYAQGDQLAAAHGATCAPSAAWTRGRTLPRVPETVMVIAPSATAFARTPAPPATQLTRSATA